jgi:hypothetical protein
MASMASTAITQKMKVIAGGLTAKQMITRSIVISNLSSEVINEFVAMRMLTSVGFTKSQANEVVFG